MKITINQGRCMGAAVCTDVCEDVFTLDSDGNAQLREEYQGATPYAGEVPNDLTCVKQAANYCPANAILIEASDTPHATEHGGSTWRRRFWIGSAVVAVVISIVQLVLYRVDLIGVNDLLFTPLIILGGIALGYLMQRLHERMSEETLVRERRVISILLGTLLLGFIIWGNVFLLLSLFPLPTWWEQYGFVVALLPSYVVGGLVGYLLSKRVHVNRGVYILMGVWLGFFAVAIISYIFMYVSQSFPYLNHWSVRTLLFIGIPVLSGLLGDFIGEWRNYYLPGSLTYEPKS